MFTFRSQNFCKSKNFHKKMFLLEMLWNASQTNLMACSLLVGGGRLLIVLYHRPLSFSKSRGGKFSQEIFSFKNVGNFLEQVLNEFKGCPHFEGRGVGLLFILYPRPRMSRFWQYHNWFNNSYITWRVRDTIRYTDPTPHPPPSSKIFPPLKIFLGTFQNISNQKKKN